VVDFHRIFVDYGGLISTLILALILTF